VKRISDDPRMKTVVRLVLKAAACRADVLLVGESGVGKAYLARRIHEASSWAGRPFKTVYCLPDADPWNEGPSLVDRLRSLEHRCGTVYVRGIDLLGPFGRNALADYLDDRHRRRNLKLPPLPDFARLVFSSQSRLGSEGVGRESLRRLAAGVGVIRIEVPPLRQRTDDVVSLARHFVRLYSKKESKQISELSGEAERLLMGRAWEGNIHELRNLMNRAVVMSDGGGPLSAGVLEGALLAAETFQERSRSGAA
jgi:DNA-binding NtrC family response regulator